MTTKVLRIDASARQTGSVTRALNDRVIDRLGATDVTHRDLTDALPQIDETWVGATFTAPSERTEAQRAALALSDTLVAELKAADVLVIGTPLYNFSIPASLKAWIDQIARVGETFQYTTEGPVGLLKGKKAIVNLASGGVAIGSDADFASNYLRHVLGFVGITDVTIVTEVTFDEVEGLAA
jgi:FMN-dependent NADH-azoreductase